ncbi:GTPase Era [Wolbachia endosymbiont of Howardula sp.]|uniref:GTPase Era n=1 Tax=Wolbachia endosymbiont of Howardula sp. TaxID=2916816 RepID=UPI00217EE9A8|nr:GTPase Era [Wolbachia endosymbiont of Howardula sp.]UWI83210.1 GTPase Era [Wolbachia endosymbiont of Howardula sp.]
MKEKKCLLATIAGAPNSGKSTLTNSIIGKNITIVTHKAQTTRTQIRGIIVRENTQIILTDCPGLISAKTPIEKYMSRSSWSAIKRSDLTIILIDAIHYRMHIEHINNIFICMNKTHRRYILVINKIDLLHKHKLYKIYDTLTLLYKSERIFLISALTCDGVADLVNYLYEIAPLSPWLYNKNIVTNVSTNFLSAEITREKLFLNLYEELPYSTAVMTEQCHIKQDKSMVIKQVIFVLKESHKKIILGTDGNNIKKINIAARYALEKFFECKIHLFLFIKVRPWIQFPEEYICNNI